MDNNIVVENDIITVYDISNPTKPYKVSEIQNDGGRGKNPADNTLTYSELGGVNDIKIRRIANKFYLFAAGRDDHGISIVDVTNPGDPFPVANQAIGDRSNQQMQLGPGNDTLTGGGGDDLLMGGPGSDLLDGGSNNDVLKGGKGADLFRLSKGNDQILDFKLNVDKLWYKESPKELWFTQQDDDLLIESRDGLKTLLVGIDKRQALMVDLFAAGSKFNFDG